MKAISLQQPWASLVVMGAKKVETRPWNTSFRGTLLIHASKGTTMGRDIWFKDPFAKYIKKFDALPFGAIIGEVKLVSTEPTETMRKKIGTEELGFGDYSTGRTAWLLSHAVQYKNPIPWIGALSIFDVAYDDFMEVKKRIDKLYSNG